MMENFMIFTIESQLYGINLKYIREIVTYTHFTKMPDSKQWVVGLIETRGYPMPIIDLRIRLKTQMSPTYNDKTVIVATKLEGGKLLGLVVDTVEDIQSFDDSEVLSSNDIDTRMQSSLLKGYIQKESYSILILNHEEFGVLNEIDHIINNDKVTINE